MSQTNEIWEENSKTAPKWLGKTTRQKWTRIRDKWVSATGTEEGGEGWDAIVEKALQIKEKNGQPI